MCRLHGLPYHAAVVPDDPREPPNQSRTGESDQDADGRPDGGESADRLWVKVYSQLRAQAQKEMNAERASHTLSATALVHEAFVKLHDAGKPPWQDQSQFYAAAVVAMRRLLIDHARRRAAGKRGGAEARRAAIELSELPDLRSEEESAGFLILDEAILRLEGADAQAAAVVRLRYFAGLSIEQTAETLGVSAPTVKRSWAFARGWLREAIESGRI